MRSDCVAHRFPTANNSQYSGIQQLEAHGQLTKLQLESLVLQRQGITHAFFLNGFFNVGTCDCAERCKKFEKAPVKLPDERLYTLLLEVKGACSLI